jgi:hypothetical protein
MVDRQNHDSEVSSSTPLEEVALEEFAASFRGELIRPEASTSTSSPTRGRSGCARAIAPRSTRGSWHSRTSGIQRTSSGSTRTLGPLPPCNGTL